MNEKWFDTMPDCAARFFPEEKSDNFPAKVFLTTDRQRGKRSFQFCNVWSRVSEGWN